jgi:hypothetical protein
MDQTTEYRLGAEVFATDGLCGVVTRIVVDPVDRTITHLVVEPKHRFGLGRLLPVDRLDAGAEGIHFRGDLAAFEAADSAEDAHFIRAADDWPGEGLVEPEAVVNDTLPGGEVALRPGDSVHATDGEIGSVQGFLTAAGQHQVTHVLLREGHLFTRKEVAIPIDAIAGVDTGIRLNLSKKEIEDLPPVDAKHPPD